MSNIEYKFEGNDIYMDLLVSGALIGVIMALFLIVWDSFVPSSVKGGAK